jgi:hypothetical protein
LTDFAECVSGNDDAGEPEWLGDRLGVNPEIGIGEVNECPTLVNRCAMDASDDLFGLQLQLNFDVYVVCRVVSACSR